MSECSVNLVNLPYWAFNYYTLRKSTPTTRIISTKLCFKRLEIDDDRKVLFYVCVYSQKYFFTPFFRQCLPFEQALKCSFLLGNFCNPQLDNTVTYA